MYAGRVFACCRLVSRVEYVPRALFGLKKDGTNGRMDGRTYRYSTLAARLGQRNEFTNYT